MAHADAVTVLFTQRTAHLAAHAGQIAFPGGKIDPGDTGPAGAALRETAEEIGLAPASVSVARLLDPYLSRTGYRIIPVVARIEPGFTLALNADEVQRRLRGAARFPHGSRQPSPREPYVFGPAALFL